MNQLNGLKQLIAEVKPKKHGSWIIVYCSDTYRYLIGKRTIDKKWDFFGGNIDKGENAKQAAIREFLEETNIKQKNVKTLAVIKNKTRVINIFKSTMSSTIKIPINKKEHSTYKWVKLEDFPKNVNTPTNKIIKWLKINKDNYLKASKLQNFEEFNIKKIKPKLIEYFSKYGKVGKITPIKKSISIELLLTPKNIAIILKEN